MRDQARWRDEKEKTTSVLVRGGAVPRPQEQIGTDGAHEPTAAEGCQRDGEENEMRRMEGLPQLAVARWVT